VIDNAADDPLVEQPEALLEAVHTVLSGSPAS
jgi:hypothetical protein